MVRLNLSLDNVKNCEKTTTFMKGFEKIIECKKKGILNFKYKHGLLFEKFKKSNKFKEIYMENGVSKLRLRKVLEKYPKLNKFKQL